MNDDGVLTVVMVVGIGSKTWSHADVFVLRGALSLLLRYEQNTESP